MRKEEKKEINVFLNRINTYINSWSEEGEKVHRIEKSIVLDALKTLYVFIDDLEEVEENKKAVHHLSDYQFPMNTSEDEMALEDTSVKAESESESTIPTKDEEPKDEEPATVKEEEALMSSDDAPTNDSKETEKEKPISSLLNYIDLKSIKEKRRKKISNKPSSTTEKINDNPPPVEAPKKQVKKMTDDDKLEDLYAKAVRFFQNDEKPSNHVPEKETPQAIETISLADVNIKEELIENDVKIKEELTEEIVKPVEDKPIEAEETSSHFSKEKKTEPNKHSLNDLFSSLNDEENTVGNILNQKKVDDIKDIIDINQRIAFVNHLFGGDSVAYTQAIKEINDADSEDQAYGVASKYGQQYHWENHLDVKEQLMYCIYLKFKN